MSVVAGCVVRWKGLFEVDRWCGHARDTQSPSAGHTYPWALHPWPLFAVIRRCAKLKEYPSKTCIIETGQNLVFFLRLLLSSASLVFSFYLMNFLTFSLSTILLERMSFDWFPFLQLLRSSTSRKRRHLSWVFILKVSRQEKASGFHWTGPEMCSGVLVWSLRDSRCL